jgi:protein-S-isoprenylcysteine O-methyltransferase Ste14
MTEHWVIATALGVVVLGWLVVSFLSPNAQRRKVEWIAATGLYVVLFGLFSNGLRSALADDSLVRTFAFGFLVVIFGSGLAISTVRTIGALLGKAGSGGAGATH